MLRTTKSPCGEILETSVFDKLVSALKAHDAAAINTLYHTCFSQIHRYATCLLRNPTDAEEAASHVIEKLLAHYESIEDAPRWIFTVTKNWCRTRFSREARRKEIREGSYANTLETVSLPGGYHKLVSEDLLSEIAKALNPAEQTLLQYRIDGMSNPEIAETLQLSIKTVSNRNSIIRKKLKAKLAYQEVVI